LVFGLEFGIWTLYRTSYLSRSRYLLITTDTSVDGGTVEPPIQPLDSALENGLEIRYDVVWTLLVHDLHRSSGRWAVSMCVDDSAEG